MSIVQSLVCVVCLGASWVLEADANPQPAKAEARHGFAAAWAGGPGAMTVDGFGTYQAALLMARLGWRFSGGTALFIGATNARSIDGDADGYLYEGAIAVHGQFLTTERTWVEVGAGWSVTHEVRDGNERMVVGKMGLGASVAGGLVLGTAGRLSIDLRVVAQEAIHPFGRAEQLGLLLGVSWN
ncbi:MAG TPA: hypothetical protein VMZ28_00480 [Kofleriaceae bacterium]|nr:hypothetical protein [Kofleriaceae bacterium]